jgi:hypothetical protein
MELLQYSKDILILELTNMATHNPGYITASTVGPLLTGKTDKLIAGGKTFALQIAFERAEIADLTLNNSFSGSVHTDWGNEYEDEAIHAYESQKLLEVTDQQKNAKKGWLSCTPDGYVGKDGLVEIKCPSVMQNHLNNLIREEWVKQYEDQVQFQMMITGRKWCDLVSYDPRFKDGYRLKVVRIKADPERHEFIMNRVDQAEEIIKEELELIKQFKK